MASREEFSALALADQQHQSGEGGGNGTTSDWVNSWVRQQGQGERLSPLKSRPPPSRKFGEQAPLLMPPMPQSVLPPSSKPRGRHGRSRSDFVSAPQPQSSHLPHPFKKGILSAPINLSGLSGNRPPRASAPPPPPPPFPVISPLSGSLQPLGGSGTRKVAHRRAKSDIPLALFGGSVGGGRRDITKADLLKSFPDPRWGGAAPGSRPLPHSGQRSRTGSDGPFDGTGSVTSGVSGYGAITSDSDGRGHPLLQSIGSVELKGSSVRHVRAMSDASIRSVTTNLAKSSLFKGVTDTGRIQLQLPKDSFRVLMDSQLEAGYVYKRKLIDDEDQFFVEFHTVDDDPPDDASNPHLKRLPPNLYVMAVDSTLYRRMLDEVIQSRSMPCGTFFCGHHEDVRHPDITIAALIVGVVFFLLLAGTTYL
mmetsp:Transcript_11333/g.20838  ORF Transcript_11333/g.20838 Transcript_11333/m.20838 type:complete len:421 (+) Transcript_11333:76-1338(+)|eukprot:CAMPEP_0201921610 /NCGR_PEP_ID=MMETSP0903-20130614/9889_1 /ASSEMBLY_ACC=CAM_ASM_000552 /TAXON_ID=420261 /ORGANISM="Thalassiosira antarctica, Strain CCMP982" /LENGTH=420 /DNA_ID=CAMNT_0048458603 /DNA_START=40 /DNA_END=1302 /DNA_ORIENTATION=+